MKSPGRRTFQSIRNVTAKSKFVFLALMLAAFAQPATAQQYELTNEVDASLVGGKLPFQAICPFGYGGLQSLVHTQKKCVPRKPG